MKRALLLGGSALFLIGTAHADSATKFEASIMVDRNAATSQESLRSIEKQAITACSYEDNSVLAGLYDKTCVRDVVEQTLAKLNNEELNQAYLATGSSAS